jgi:hypothetical protein
MSSVLLQTAMTKLNFRIFVRRRNKLKLLLINGFIYVHDMMEEEVEIIPVIHV